ncbi:uncharacterized protein KY384_001709 [Bacidia gigantensis]|uniref:uncharacterized protein n=1 Tax=Bacidia gigantensis TaxID=2732470 RepID=UPI001D05C02A|nr:uncharacterized protein KY384_001709 [Bacidia gigantensis]KAG8533966.1 hypothetical protein KY384_001709 [Bacidia gigantensis]
MPGGRPKKNRDFFDDKRDEMYEMYITQNKTLDEVRDRYEEQGISASIRAYQARFKEWGFPPKRARYVDLPDIHDRVKYLWEQNVSHKEMLEILNAEGFNVSDRQLAKVRRKDGLKMRDPNGDQPSLKRKRQTEDGAADEEENADADIGLDDENFTEAEPPPQPRVIPLEVQIKRQSRQAQLWAESAERLQNRTRRRRTKGWAGLPPDVGLPPRFPSELTLEEGRTLLGLDKKLYTDIRSTFEDICKAHEVNRKSSCAPGLWPWVKEELISRVPHLQNIFRIPEAASYESNREPMALDLICMDVTKKIRTTGKYLSLGDSKNLLGLTPDESRDIRKIFFDVLKEDFFTIKLDVTKEHWESLKEKWIQQSPRLQREFQNLDDSDVWHMKHKALEAIARDVQKRNRDDQIQRDPNKAQKESKKKEPKPKKGKQDKKEKKERPLKQPKEKGVTHGPEHRTPSGRPPWMPATPPPQSSPSLASAPTNNAPEARVVPMESPSEAGQTPFPAPTPQTQHLTFLPTQTPNKDQSPPSRPSQPTVDASFTFPEADLQIDPSLLEAAALPSTQGFGTRPTAYRQPSDATSIYIRPSPASLQKYPNITKLWLDTITPPYALPVLRAVMARKLTGAYTVVRIEGLADGRTVYNQLGSAWEIDEDEILEAYMSYQREQGGRLFLLST